MMKYQNKNLKGELENLNPRSVSLWKENKMLQGYSKDMKKEKDILANINDDLRYQIKENINKNGDLLMKNQKK